MPHLSEIKEKTPPDPEINRKPRAFEENYPFVEEDEINLLDYLIVLLKHKKLIIGMVLAAGLAGLIMTFFRSETKLYKSEAIIVPQHGGIASFRGSNRNFSRQNQFSVGSSSSGKLLMMLESRGLTAKVIEKNNLMPVLFSDSWDKKDNKWVGAPPTLHAACEVMKGLLKTGPAQGKASKRSFRGNQLPISVSIRYREPETAKAFVDDYLNELSETLREEALRDAREKKRFLEKQLETVIDPLMKDKIHTLRAKEIEKETFAKAKKYYGFTVMDPPAVPDRLSAENPKFARNTVLGMVVAFFLAVFLAFIIEYVRRIKTEDTERYQDLLRELKTWRSSGKKKG